MNKPKSKFVRNKIKRLKLNTKNKSYIEDLLLLEKFILGEVIGWAGGVLANNKADEYGKEYKAIYKELDLAGYREHLEREKKEKLKEARENRKFESESRKENIKTNKLWGKLGGKL